jgi:hypothetical protein
MRNEGGDNDLPCEGAEAVRLVPGLGGSGLEGSGFRDRGFERVYGWLSLHDKLGADGFSDADERAAMAIGSFAGFAYRNTRLFDELQLRVATLESGVRRMIASCRTAANRVKQIAN